MRRGSTPHPIAVSSEIPHFAHTEAPKNFQIESKACNIVIKFFTIL